MKKQKQILSKLMDLGNKEADKYLNDFAGELKLKLLASFDNTEIKEGLELLEEFVYKVPKIATEIIEYIIFNPHEVKIQETPFGPLDGDSYEKIAIKALEILGEIRYIYSDAILSLLARTINGQKNTVIKNKALEIVKEFTKYDYNVLTKSKIGYGPQRKALDFIKVFDPKERILNIDFCLTVIEQVLNSSISGTSSKSFDTLTFHSAAVDPTDFLKKMRREAIDFALDLYCSTSNQQLQLTIVKALEGAVHGPTNVVYGDNLKKMIGDDAEYLLSVYREMLFGEKNEAIKNMAVAEEIDRRIYWFHGRSYLDTPAARKLRADIISDSFYGLFRIFAGDNMVSNFEEIDGDERAEKIIEEKIKKIGKENIATWEQNMNRIASYCGLIPEWHFLRFKMFLRKFSVASPDLAFLMLDVSFRRKQPLTIFLSHFLDGFREANRYDLWDKAVSVALEQKNISYVIAIARSLNIDRTIDLDKAVRDIDLEHLESMVKKAKQYHFLSKAEKNINFEHAVLNALMRDYKRDPSRLENLIVELVKQSPKWRTYNIIELQFGLFRKWFDFVGFNSKNIEIIKNWLIEIPNFEWETQTLLKNLAGENIDLALEVIWGRIEKDASLKEDFKSIIEDRYDAIPHHFNAEFTEYLSKHPDFTKKILPWIEKVTPEWSRYSWDIAEFLKSIPGSRNFAIRELVGRGDEVSLAKAVQLLDRYDGGDLELCIEIVRKTNNKKIISSLDAVLYATGVVAGEYGISDAHQAKANFLKKYLSDDSKQVCMFAEKSIKILEDMAKNERTMSDEEKQIRKIKFEG